MGMGKYSIKDLERLSGIKAHTIRIWEKRYGIVVPERSDTNIRTYCDSDLKRLLNIAILNNNGYKISKIAAFSHNQINEKVLEVCHKGCSYEAEIDRLVVAMVDLDELKFEKIVSTNIMRQGFELTITNVIFPFLTKIGVMWQTGSINPAQEHYMTNLIRQKLIVAIDSLGFESFQYEDSFLLFLPEGEMHELGLLFYQYLTRKYGYPVVYLGQSVPFEDLVSVARIRSPKYLLTCLTAPMEKFELDAWANFLSIHFPENTIFISIPENAVPDVVLPENCVRIGPNQDFREHLSD